MPFSPEHFMAPETSPTDWAQLRSASMARLAQTVGTRRREEEQTRQFDITAGETQRQHDLLAQQAAAQLEHDWAKLSNEVRQKQIQRHIDGMKLIREAHRQAEGVKEFNANASNIASSHRLMMTPKGLMPADVAAQIAAQTNAPDPVGPTAPPSAAPAGEVTPEGAAPQAPAYEPDAMPGIEEAIGVPGAGLAPPGPVTTGADAVAQTAVTPGTDELPLDPKDALTAEEAQKADQENPVVAPEQEVPGQDPHEVMLKKLKEQKPATAVEQESRAQMDGYLAGELKRRVDIIKAASLSPVAEAITINMANKALGFPAIPIPQVSAPDPSLPAEMQGSGEWEMTIPPHLSALAEAPPQPPRDVVRDAIQSGGWDYWDMDTGEHVGSDNWEDVQASRIEYRRQAYAPLEEMAANDQERAEIHAATESVARSGDTKNYNVLMGLWRIRASAAATRQRSDALARADRNEYRQIVKDVTAEQRALIKEKVSENKIVEAKDTLRQAEEALQVLRSTPEGNQRNALEQRGLLAGYLKTLMGARATDKDADLALQTDFWTDLQRKISYLEGDGKLPDAYLEQLTGVFNRLARNEKQKQLRFGTSLYRDVRESYLINGLAPEDARGLARDSLLRTFPEMPDGVVKGIIDKYDSEEHPSPYVLRETREPTSSSTSSSSRTGATVTVTGPRMRGGKTSTIKTVEDVKALVGPAPGKGK